MNNLPMITDTKGILHAVEYGMGIAYIESVVGSHGQGRKEREMRIIESTTWFDVISRQEAKRICGGRLPRQGYERIGQDEGVNYWVSRKLYRGVLVWTATETAWDMTPTGAILTVSGVNRYDKRHPVNTTR